MDNETTITNDVNSMTKESETIKTGLGARLRKAREAIHLTEKEAAARLYLNVNIISIMEKETFADGPPVTFMRGYLRSYARMLNFPDHEIKAAVDELEISVPPIRSFAPILHATPINRSDRYISWITYLIILTLISLVTLWWNSHSKYVIADVPATPSQLTQPFINANDELDTTKPINVEEAATQVPEVTSTASATTPAAASDVAPVTTAPSTTTAPIAQAQLITPATTTSPAQAAQTPLPVIQPATTATLSSAPATKKPQLTNLQQQTIAQDNTSATDTTPAVKPKKQKHKSAISNMALALPEPG